MVIVTQVNSHIFFFASVESNAFVKSIVANHILITPLVAFLIHKSVRRKMSVVW